MRIRGLEYRLKLYISMELKEKGKFYPYGMGFKPGNSGGHHINNCTRQLCVD
jgi:hypothetical protein